MTTEEKKRMEALEAKVADLELLLGYGIVNEMCQDNPGMKDAVGAQLKKLDEPMGQASGRLLKELSERYQLG